jgi:hypothetical protein
MRHRALLRAQLERKSCQKSQVCELIRARHLLHREEGIDLRLLYLEKPPAMVSSV